MHVLRLNPGAAPPLSPSSASTAFQPLERSRAAFTLIEVIVAMAIFALVMLAIYTSWTAILRGSKVGLTAAAEAQRSRVAVRAVREALTSAQLYMENMRYY